MAHGMAWEDRGAAGAEAIVLVRPLGGSMALWGEFASVLERSLRVIAFDARGTGDSTGPARVSTRALAADALAILDARGVASAHVFGISLGGMVATRLALDAPSRVLSLAVASTAARGLAFERAGLLRGLSFARCLARPAPQAERCLVTRILSHRFRREHPREAARIEALAARAPASRATLVAHALAAALHDARSELGRIDARTLVLVGERDHLLGPTAGVDLMTGIRGASRALIAGAGHDLTLERPTETADRVLELVAAPGRRAPV